ncbi:hypothetical protein EOY24_22800 [Salmonella enterica]|nr:hypothetical protein [Salmonella enterica]
MRFRFINTIKIDRNNRLQIAQNEPFKFFLFLNRQFGKTICVFATKFISSGSSAFSKIINVKQLA